MLLYRNQHDSGALASCCFFFCHTVILYYTDPCVSTIFNTFSELFLHLFSHVFSLWFYLFLYFLIFLSITSISFFSHSWYHSWEVLTQYHNLWLIKWCWSQKPQLWCKNYFFAAMSLLFFLGGKNYWYAKENWPDKWSYFIFTYKTCSSYHGNFADPDGL